MSECPHSQVNEILLLFSVEAGLWHASRARVSGWPVPGQGAVWIASCLGPSFG